VLAYLPQRRQLPDRILPVATAWKGIESVLGDLIEKFDIGTRSCLEFGVEHGYSTAALSCFFDAVTGVDIFVGDKHTRDPRDLFASTSDRLASFKNIRLVRSDYREWAATDQNVYDLIHIDIVHTYVDTFACGNLECAACEVCSLSRYRKLSGGETRGHGYCAADAEALL